jgi:hypothetical protein
VRLDEAFPRSQKVVSGLLSGLNRAEWDLVYWQAYPGDEPIERCGNNETRGKRNLWGRPPTGAPRGHFGDHRLM